MTAARVLVRMYPQAVREQWGSDLEAEIAAAGWRSWPNTLLGIADMWLHPCLWPAGSRAQRQLRTTTLAISVTALCWFVAHVGIEADTALSRGVGHSRPMSAGLTLMMAGLVLVAPLPRPSTAGLLALVRTAAARFAFPVALGAAVVTAVRLGMDAQAPLPLRGLVLAGWWAALAIGAARACLIAADVGARFVVPPRPGRLRLGTWVLISGAATEAATVLGFSLRSRPDLPAIAIATSVLTLLLAFVPVLRDCHPPTAADGE